MRHTTVPTGDKLLDPNNSLIRAMICLYKSSGHVPPSLAKRLKDAKLVRAFGEPFADEHKLSRTTLHACFCTLHALQKRERGEVLDEVDAKYLQLAAL